MQFADAKIQISRTNTQNFQYFWNIIASLYEPSRRLQTTNFTNVGKRLSRDEAFIANKRNLTYNSAKIKNFQNSLQFKMCDRPLRLKR